MCFVVNVYSKCSLVNKKVMWVDPCSRKKNLGGRIWYVLGDFNFICTFKERVEGERSHWFIWDYRNLRYL